MSKDGRPISDWLGKVFGLLVFLGGVGLLLLVFKLAYDQFNVPPEQVLKIKKGEPFDVSIALQGFGAVFLRVMLLVVMSVVGSLVANRGIAMFTGSRALPGSWLQPKMKKAEPTEDSASDERDRA
jgi:flagellar biosynthesis protein FlhB